jgi:hypothetical protein
VGKPLSVPTSSVANRLNLTGVPLISVCTYSVFATVNLAAAFCIASRPSDPSGQRTCYIDTRSRERLPQGVAVHRDAATEIVEDLHSHGHGSVAPACAITFCTSSTVSEVLWLDPGPGLGLFLLTANLMAPLCCSSLSETLAAWARLHKHGCAIGLSGRSPT